MAGFEPMIYHMQIGASFMGELGVYGPPRIVKCKNFALGLPVSSNGRHRQT